MYPYFKLDGVENKPRCECFLNNSNMILELFKFQKNFQGMAEQYSDLCQTSRIQLFAKIVNGKNLLTLFQKAVLSFCAPTHTNPDQPTPTHKTFTPTHTNPHQPMKSSHPPIKNLHPPTPTHTDPRKSHTHPHRSTFPHKKFTSSHIDP